MYYTYFDAYTIKREGNKGGRSSPLSILYTLKVNDKSILLKKRSNNNNNNGNIPDFVWIHYARGSTVYFDVFIQNAVEGFVEYI